VGLRKGGLLHLRSFRLKRGALMYGCTDQSDQWLIKTTDNHKFGSEARNLQTSVMVAHKTKDKVIKSYGELLKWIKDPTQGFILSTGGCWIGCLS
jgi:hypothetical protein